MGHECSPGAPRIFAEPLPGHANVCNDMVCLVESAGQGSIKLHSEGQPDELWASQPRAQRCDDDSAEAPLKLRLAGPRRKVALMAHFVLVIGGTGMLGEPVARRLAKDGHRVRILTRNSSAARQRFGSPFEVVQGDVEDVRALETGLQGCSAVHLSLDGKGDWDLERRAAVLVTDLGRRLGLRRVTMISGASTCEENAWFPMVPARLAAEKAIRDCGVPYTLFRCTMFMELLPTFVHGVKAILMGRQPARWHWIAAEDYARMVSTAFDTPEAEGKTLYVYGPEALTMAEAIDCYRMLCAPDAKLTEVPFWILSIMAMLPGREQLRRVGLPIMRYFSKVSEIGEPDEANQLLGAPCITLEQWCQKRAEQLSDRPSD